jgi:hypothetical protein
VSHGSAVTLAVLDQQSTFRLGTSVYVVRFTRDASAFFIVHEGYTRTTVKSLFFGLFSSFEAMAS